MNRYNGRNGNGYQPEPTAGTALPPPKNPNASERQQDQQWLEAQRAECLRRATKAK